MTEHEWTLLQHYVRHLGDIIGLRDWTLIVSRDALDNDDAFAMVRPVEGKKHATIFVCKDFRAQTPEEQREVITHELIHCHLATAIDVIRLDLCRSAVLGQPVYDICWNAFKRQIEYAVDGMAEEWAKSLPLIVWDGVV
jgi:hypothetical protein